MISHFLFSQPRISTSAAHYISFGLASIYVGSLYLSKNVRTLYSGKGAKPSTSMRDDPDVIRARLVAASVATVVCCLAVFGVIWDCVVLIPKPLDMITDTTFLRLGFPITSFSPIMTNYSNVYPHLVTPLLFLGPLFAKFLSHDLPGQRNWTWEFDVVGRFFSLHGMRNYCIGPITEEIVFRSCILAVYHMSGASTMRMIFCSPLLFGLAHVHHAWDTYHAKGANAAALRIAFLVTLFQLSYTSLFGFYTSYLFLRTGLILPPITAHIFCNIMGLPQIGYELRKHHRYRSQIKAAYVVGIIGFIYTLVKWTRTEGNFYWPHAGETDFAHYKYQTLIFNC